MKNIHKYLVIALVMLVQFFISCDGIFNGLDLEGDVDVSFNLDEVNTNLSSIKTVVDALTSGDYITDVQPLIADGAELGYKLTFYRHGEVDIYCRNGESDSVQESMFGVKKGADGLYYWTYDGEILVDDTGKGLLVSSNEDVPGVTIELKVKDGSLYLSYDDGNSWKEMLASVSDGCIFKNITVSKDSVFIELLDGEVIEFVYSSLLKVVLRDTSVLVRDMYKSVQIPFTVEGALGEVELSVAEHECFTFDFSWNETKRSGSLRITQIALASEREVKMEDVISVYSSGVKASTTLNIVPRYFDISLDESILMSPEEGEVSIPFLSNIDFNIVNISAGDWFDCKVKWEGNIGYVVISAEENKATASRGGELYFEHKWGRSYFSLYQKAVSCKEVFNCAIECYEFNDYHFTSCDLSSLISENGLSVFQALGYSSMEDLFRAMGSYEVYRKYGGDVKVFTFMDDKGDIIYHPYSVNAIGYWMKSNGEYTTWGNDNCCYYELNGEGYGDGAHEYDIFFGLMPGVPKIGDCYSFPIYMQSSDARIVINVTLDVVPYIDPEEGLYSDGGIPGQYLVTVNREMSVSEYGEYVPFYIGLKEVQRHMGLTKYQIFQLENKYSDSGELISGLTVDYLLADGTPSFIDGYPTVWVDSNSMPAAWGRENVMSFGFEKGLDYFRADIRLGTTSCLNNPYSYYVGTTFSFIHKFTYIPEEAQGNLSKGVVVYVKYNIKLVE